MWATGDKRDENQLWAAADTEGHPSKDGSIPLWFAPDGKTLLTANGKSENGIAGISEASFQSWDVATSRDNSGWSAEFHGVSPHISIVGAVN